MGWGSGVVCAELAPLCSVGVGVRLGLGGYVTDALGTEISLAVALDTMGGWMIGALTSLIPVAPSSMGVGSAG